MISKFKYENLLILIAIVFTLIVNFLMQINYQTFVFGDSFSYILAAKELYIKAKLNDHRPLVITIINGFPLLFNNNEKNLFLWSFILNYFCWLTTIILLFNIAKKIVDIKKSFIITLCYILCIGNFFIIFDLLSETIFIFLLVLILYFTTLFDKSKSIMFLVYNLCLLILMTMIKPLSVGLIFIFIFIYFKDLKLIFRCKYLVLIFLSLSVLAIQLINMKKQFGNYTISYIDGVTYYNYLGTRADCYKKNIEFVPGRNKRIIELKDKTMIEIKLIAKKDFINQLSNNKYNLLKAYFFNVINNSTKGSGSVHECVNKKNTCYFVYFLYIFKAVSKIQNIVFTFLGFILSIYFIFTKASKLIKFTSVLILYFIFISAISSNQGDRFHIVFYPLVIILIITGNFKIKPQ